MGLRFEDRFRTYRMFIDAAEKRRGLEVASFCAPDVRISTPLTEVWGGDLRGHDGVFAWVRRMDEEFAFLVATLGEAEQREGDWLLGSASIRSRGVASPTEIEFELHHAVHFAAELIDEFHAVLTREEAIERIASTRSLV